MPSNQIPEDVRAVAADAIENLDWSQAEFGYLPANAEIVDAVAPLIIQWARQDQAKVDASLAREWLGRMHRDSPSKAFPDALEAVIRAQFADETGGE